MSTLPLDDTPGRLSVQFQPATGDTAQISGQGVTIASSGSMLAQQAQHITGIASAVSPNWDGEAAGAYQGLSGQLASAFGRAAMTIGTAAELLTRYASDLEDLQREGKTAESETKRLIELIHQEDAKLRIAITDVGNAEQDLRDAQTTIMMAAGRGPAGTGVVAAARGQATAATGALQRAQDAERTARRALTQADEELHTWQQRGKRAEQDARDLGERVAGQLLLMTIAPPPLPGSPDYPELPPLPQIMFDSNGDDGGGGDAGGTGGEGDEVDKGRGDDDKGKDGGKKPENPYDNPDRNPAQDKKLSDTDVKQLADAGLHPHDIKDHGSHSDLYKDRDGNVYEKSHRDPTGPGEPIGISLNDLYPEA